MEIVHLGIQVLGLLSGPLLLWRVPTPERGEPGELPSVSVIVPARDEERRLPVLLASLSAQTLRPTELLVVDDSSTDRTAEIAREAGASLISAPALPPGWAGKPWACWTGANAASGETLVFLDADTKLAPDGLARIVAESCRAGGLVAVQPYHETVLPYEQLSAIFNLVMMMALGAMTVLGDRHAPNGAFGPCVAVGRADYFRVGGHAAAPGAVLEDVALGRGFASAGLPVRCLGGRGAISFRMYAEGLSQLVEGWSKGFAGGAIGTSAPLLLAVVLWVSAGWSLTVDATRLVFSSLADPGLAGFLYAAYALEFGWLLSRIGRFQRWVAPLFPVSIVFFTLVFLRSLLLALVVRRVRWKGRDIATGFPRAASERDGGG